jgi:toxin ParE1/3/4
VRLVYAPRALRDIDEILAYIQSRSRQGAGNVSRAIERAMELCALNPYNGAPTNESNLYRYPLARYRFRVFYRVDAARDVVEIARVIHGARVRDLGRLPDED